MAYRSCLYNRINQAPKAFIFASQGPRRPILRGLPTLIKLYRLARRAQDRDSGCGASSKGTKCPFFLSGIPGLNVIDYSHLGAFRTDTVWREVPLWRLRYHGWGGGERMLPCHMQRSCKAVRQRGDQPQPRCHPERSEESPSSFRERFRAGFLAPLGMTPWARG